jgi:molybdate transport system ATP-binding protein
MVGRQGAQIMNGGLDIKLKHSFGVFDLDVDLSSALGGVTAVFGPSGSGKTSLINAVAGLFEPTEGRIQVGEETWLDTARGINLAAKDRRVGYVFQDARLFPKMRVRENLTYATRFGGAGDLAGVTEMLGIDDLLDRYPRDLSGGEAQRVAIGRALMRDAKLLLMDEPLAALDQHRRDEILPYLDRLKRFSGVQMIYVSHAMSEVARLADTLALMKDGRITRAGLVGDILADPAAVPDIGVREAGSILDLRLAKVDAGDGLSELKTSAGRLLLPQLGMTEGARVRVRILASDIILSRDRPDGLSALNALPAKISDMHDGFGPGVAVGLRSGEDRLVARITRRSVRLLKLKVGTPCFAVIKTVSVAGHNVGQLRDLIPEETS